MRNGAKNYNITDEKAGSRLGVCLERENGGASPAEVGVIPVRIWKWVVARRSSINRVTEDLARGLPEVGRGLVSLVSDSEHDFLQIVTAIQEFHSQSVELAADATKLASLIAGGETERAWNDLREILAQIHAFISKEESETQSIMAAMERFLSILEDMRGPLTSFGRIVNMLNMLGVATRIENARLLRDDTGFDILSAAVDKLAVDIGEKTGKILVRIGQLNGLIRESVRRTSSLAALQRTQSRSILDGVSSSMGELEKRRLMAGQVAAGVSGGAAETAKSIESILASMQFHDITRQQLEHVKEALEEVATSLRPASAGGCEAVWSWTSVRDAIKLQNAQIDHAGNQLSLAVEDVKTKMYGIGDNVLAMVERAEELFSSGSSQDNSFLREVEAGVGRIGKSLHQNELANRDMSEAVASVAATVGEIAGYISEIDRVGIAIKYLSLNALVQAVHIGEDGLALEVLSQEIQHLSEHTIQQIDIVSESLKTVAKLSGDLRRIVDAAPSSSGSEAGIMEAELNSLMVSLHKENGDVEKILGGIRRKGGRFTVGIKKCADSFQVHRRCAGLLEEVGVRLASLAESAGALAGRPSDRERGDCLKSLSLRYTMEKEREIHSKHTSVPSTSGILARRHTSLRRMSPEDPACDSVTRHDPEVELF